MGILDDAIREHLDLKRRQGAEEDELQRLEDEAFGPPSRPGEPDFPGAEGDAAEADGELGADADEHQPAVESPAAEAGGEPADPEPTLEPEAGGEPALAPAAEAEAAPEAEAEPAPAEAGDAEAGSGFYDQSDELELDLALDDEPGQAPEAAPPVESLDTVEHRFEEAIEETGESEAAAPEPATGEEEEVVEGELAEEDEDVLEETPEFLRDAPEDDELWFEQGEPKDFDF